MSDMEQDMRDAYQRTAGDQEGDSPDQVKVDNVGAEPQEKDVDLVEDDGASGDEDIGRDELGRFKARDVVEHVEGEEDEEDGEDGEFLAADEAEAEDEPDADDEPEGKKDVAAPSYLPIAVQEAWADLPPEAQQAVAKSQLEMSTKLRGAMRAKQAVEPILHEIQRATQQFPELAQQTPEQVAKDVFELAQTRVNLRRDPVGTLLQVANALGVTDQLAAHVNGTATGPDTMMLQQKIAQMEQELQAARNPATIANVVQEQLSAQAVEREISEFAQGKEFWSVVEADIPALIPAAQYMKGEGASRLDVLETAYEMAIDAMGLRSVSQPPAKDRAKSDHRKAKAARKARSVNVTPRPAQKQKLSEEERMARAYRKAMRA